MAKFYASNPVDGLVPLNGETLMEAIEGRGGTRLEIRGWNHSHLRRQRAARSLDGPRRLRLDPVSARRLVAGQIGFARRQGKEHQALTGSRITFGT